MPDLHIACPNEIDQTRGCQGMVAAVARTVALPVVSVIHQIKAKLTSELPRRENACPVQMVKKGNFQPIFSFLFNSFLILIVKTPLKV
jgi:hypothetical protein